MNQPAPEIAYPNEMYLGPFYPGSAPYPPVHDTSWYVPEQGYPGPVGADGIPQGTNFLLQNPTAYLPGNDSAAETMSSQDSGVRYDPRLMSGAAQRPTDPSGASHRPPSFVSADPSGGWSLSSNAHTLPLGPHQGQSTGRNPNPVYASSQSFPAFPSPSSAYYNAHQTHRHGYEGAEAWMAPDTSQTSVGTEMAPSAPVPTSPPARQLPETRKPWQLQRHGTIPAPASYNNANRENNPSRAPPSAAAAFHSFSTLDPSHPPKTQSQEPITFQPRQEKSATLVSPYPPICDFDYYGPASPASSYARVNTQLYSLANVQDLPVKGSEHPVPVTSRSSPDLHQLKTYTGTSNASSVNHCALPPNTTSQTQTKKNQAKSGSSATGPTQFQFHHSSYMTLVPSPSSSSNTATTSANSSPSSTTTPNDTSPRSKPKQLSSQNTQALQHTGHTGQPSKNVSKSSHSPTSPDNHGPFMHAMVMQYGEPASMEAILPNKKPKLAETQNDDLFASSTSSTGSQTVSPQMWPSDTPEETSSDTTSYWTPSKD